MYDVRLNHNLSSLVSCRVGRTPVRLLGLQPFRPSPSAFHFAGFVSSMLQASRTATILPQMDALKIGSFRGVYYKKCHKIFHRKNLGQKHLWGEDSYMFLEQKKNDLNMAENSPQKVSARSARHQFLFHLT